MDHGVVVNQGDCYRKLDNLDQALNKYRKALDMSGKKTPELCNRLGFAYHSLGVMDYNEKKYQDAIQSFSLAIKYYPH